jgi:hypothetical protein
MDERSPVPEPEQLHDDELASYRRAVAHAAARLARDDQEEALEPQDPDAT